MAITRQVITSLQRDGTDMLGTKSLAVKSIVSGSLLTAGVTAIGQTLQDRQALLV